MSRRGWTVALLALAGVVVLVLGVVGALAVATLGGIGGSEWDEHHLLGEGMKKVAVVRIDGEIHGGESTPTLFGDGGAGARDVTSQLRQAEEDDEVAAVVLRVDSPGGAVVASDEMARAVRRLREIKPVVASMGDLAASGGYYVASQAQRVIANPATLTGSIGVIAILPNLEGTADKLGVRPVVMTSGRLKGIGSPFKEMSPEERDIYQSLLDQAHAQFIDAVAAGRDMDEAKIRDLADGRPYSGEQAEANGLVDGLGDLEAAYDEALDLAEIRRDEARLVEYRASTGIGDLLPFGAGSPVDELRTELGLDFGLKYLYLP